MSQPLAFYRVALAEILAGEVFLAFAVTQELFYAKSSFNDISLPGLSRLSHTREVVWNS